MITVLLIAAVAGWGHVEDLGLSSYEIWDVDTRIDDCAPQSPENSPISYIGMDIKAAFPIEAILNDVNFLWKGDGSIHVHRNFGKDCSPRAITKLISKLNSPLCAVSDEAMHNNDSDIMRWSLSGVLNCYLVGQFPSFFIERGLALNNSEIRAQFPLACLSKFPICLVRSFSSAAGSFRSCHRFVNSAPCVKSSALSMYKRSPNQKNTDAGQLDGGKGGDEHPERPFRHVLLGVKIALSILTLVGGFFLSVFSFHRSGDALDEALDGNWRAWFPTIGWFCPPLLWASSGTQILAYWLSICEAC